jgi:hypothetical protein
MASIFQNHTQNEYFYVDLMAHKSIKNKTKVFKTSVCAVASLTCSDRLKGGPAVKPYQALKVL